MRRALEKFRLWQQAARGGSARSSGHSRMTIAPRSSLSEPDVEATLLAVQLRWIAARARIRRRPARFAAVQKKHAGHDAFRNTTRMASNRLTGIPTRPALAVLVGRIPSMRRSWKAISEAGTIFQGWSTCSIASPRPAGHPAHALLGEKPEVLRRRHQPPAHAGKFGDHRAEVARGDHDDAAGVEVPMTQRERLPRVRKVLDNIE